MLKNTTLEIQCKFAKFSKELKDFKKDRTDKTNNFFSQL